MDEDDLKRLDIRKWKIDSHVKRTSEICIFTTLDWRIIYISTFAPLKLLKVLYYSVEKRFLFLQKSITTGIDAFQFSDPLSLDSTCLSLFDFNKRLMALEVDVMLFLTIIIWMNAFQIVIIFLLNFNMCISY